jgi:non-ribosomal peptide synthetase component E (peptide arylation enzyme)
MALHMRHRNCGQRRIHLLTARNKEFIKIGGKRVSPKKIEEVIVSFPQVVDCTIESIQDDIFDGTNHRHLKCNSKNYFSSLKTNKK